jgi:hypothetical protein
MKYLITIVFTILLSLTIFGQEELSPDFSFNKSETDSPVYQVLPKDEKILSEADLGNAFQALGIIAQPEEGKFGLIFVNVQEDFQFEKQESKPFNLFVGNTKITGSKPTIIKKYKSKKYKIEYLAVSLTREDFEKLVAADGILVVYGSINADIPMANLSAFRFVQAKIDSDYTPRTTPSTQTPTNSNGDVRVKGYYRRDGTYVRPHTRSRPSRKN